MAKAVADTHGDCDKIVADTGGTGPRSNPSGASPEARLAELERQAGLQPEGNDADGRERRLARLRRLWGLP